jgi:UDP-N-acetylmuramate dehydrogenase
MIAMNAPDFTHCTVHGQHHPGLSRDVSLSEHSAMQIGGMAEYFAIANNAADIQCAYDWASKSRVPVVTIGGGSNIIWTDVGFAGLVLKNHIRGFRISSQGDGLIELHLGAGEILDEVVERTTEMNLTGMECLSLIPGTCGGAIIQNSGAYGQEVGQNLISVDVYDTITKRFTVLPKSACCLRYRSSIFKNEERDRYVVLGFTVRLHFGYAEMPSHPALLAALRGNSPYSPADIRSALIKVRSSRLPDPARVPSCGSFFINPLLTREKFASIFSCVEIPHQMMDDGTIKVPAACLLERCGFKNHRNAELGFGTWYGQPLVIFAIGETSYKKLLEYSGMIRQAVQETFEILLEQEPITMGG